MTEGCAPPLFGGASGYQCPITLPHSCSPLFPTFGHQLLKGTMPLVLITCTSFLTSCQVMLCHIISFHVYRPPAHPPSPPVPCNVTKDGQVVRTWGIIPFGSRCLTFPLTTPLKWGIRVSMPNNASAFLFYKYWLGLRKLNLETWKKFILCHEMMFGDHFFHTGSDPWLIFKYPSNPHRV